MNTLDFVYVNKKLTLEQTGILVEISNRLIEDLSKIKPQEDDIFDYNEKEKDFMNLIKEESTSRRLVLVYQVKEDSDFNFLHCLTMIQVLLERKENKLIAYLRSCNVIKLFSDLGFLCRLAKIGKCQRVVVFIGSLHINVED